LTHQKCDGPLCVSCFVSADFHRLLGETWTYCALGEKCVELITNEQLERHHVPFGACERNEVPPIAEGG